MYILYTLNQMDGILAFTFKMYLFDISGFFKEV